MSLDGSRNLQHWTQTERPHYFRINKNLMRKRNSVLNRQNGMTKMFPTNGSRWLKSIFITWRNMSNKRLNSIKIFTTSDIWFPGGIKRKTFLLPSPKTLKLNKLASQLPLIMLSIFDNLFRNEYIYEMHDHIAFRYEILQKLGKGSYG